MKNKRLGAESLMILCYIFNFYHLSVLCRYGGVKRHLLWMLLGLLVFCAALIYLFITDTPKVKSKTAFLVKLMTVIGATILFASSIIYSAIPYNGKLAWKIQDLIHTREVALTHTNIFDTGIEGILDDLNAALNLPEKLYIAEQFTVDFDGTGEISAIEGFLYGKDGSDQTRTYLISYDAKKSKKIYVNMDGYASADFDTDALLSPMIDVLALANWKEQVATWEQDYDVSSYQLLYLGNRSFEIKDGLVTVSGDSSEIQKLNAGGSVKGYEVSLHMPELDTVTPVRYIANPKYTSWQEQKEQELTDDSTETSSEIGKCYTDEDGIQYFYLTEQMGWRFKILDAAAGSRFYGLQQTTDGGNTWEMINEDPFVGNIGVSEGLVFYDENNGIIGLTCAGQDWSNLYRTTDGGKTFTKIEFPGATTGEFYFDMPRKDKDQLVVLARPEAGDTTGVKYVSTDGGATWENAGDF
mgnify:FL=1